MVVLLCKLLTQLVRAVDVDRRLTEGEDEEQAQHIYYANPSGHQPPHTKPTPTTSFTSCKAAYAEVAIRSARVAEDCGVV